MQHGTNRLSKVFGTGDGCYDARAKESKLQMCKSIL